MSLKPRLPPDEKVGTLYSGIPNVGVPALAGMAFEVPLLQCFCQLNSRCMHYDKVYNLGLSDRSFTVRCCLCSDVAFDFFWQSQSVRPSAKDIEAAHGCSTRERLWWIDLFLLPARYLRRRTFGGCLGILGARLVPLRSDTDQLLESCDSHPLRGATVCVGISRSR